MSIDFNYLKYKLKEYLISDFTFDEISKVLNDVEVEKYSREYVKSLGFNEEHEKALRLKYRQIIDECYQKGIPLGLETLRYNSSEDAYLARQHYLSKYRQSSFLSLIFNKSTLLITIAAICVLVVLVFAS